jgi:uncharacterized protein DUF2795
MTMAKVNPIQIQKFLKGVDYPADKATLLKKATDEGADDDVRSVLQRLPDKRYDTPADVSEAMGKIE